MIRPEAYMYIFGTAIGSIIGKYFDRPISFQSDEYSYRIYDPCTIVQRPSLIYIKKEDLSKNLSDIESFSADEAAKMHYVYNNVELMEIEGPIINDYVPIVSNKDLINNSIVINKQQIIFYTSVEVEEATRIDKYINSLLGRLKTSEIEFKKGR